MADDDQSDESGPGPRRATRNASFRVEPGDRVAIHVTGELDAESATELGALVDDVFATRPIAVVIDLADLSFIDSVGLSVLVRADHRGRAEGIGVEVHHVTPSCLRLLEITQLVDVLDIR